MKPWNTSSWARAVKACALGSLAVGCLGTANAQVASNPFTTVGYIQAFTLANAGNVFSQATMTLNGINITIPTGTLMVMPGSYFTPQQAFQGQAQSGLAIDDLNRLPHQMFEATVTGNIVNGQYIAGLVNVSPQSLNNSEGFIRSITTATGELCVGPSPTPVAACAPPNTRVRLNDVTGRHAVASVGSDPRFQLDPDNQSVKATTGYPMCIPRSAADAQCPAKNRPAGLSTFVMTGPNIPAGPNGVPPVPIVSCNPANNPALCDPALQAPLIVGDYISFSGLLMKDANVAHPYYVSAYSLNANVGIYTAAGTSPSYVTQEVLFLGTGPTAVCPGECAIKLRVLGFTTDPSRVSVTALPGSFQLNVYAVDVNNLGARTLRLIQQGGLASPKREAFFGRYRIDVALKFPQAANNLLLPTPGGATREVMVKFDAGGVPVANGTPVPTAPVVANGFVPGQFILPQPSFLFPELTLAGTPTVPNNFKCLPFLVQGWGTAAGPAGALLTNIPQLAPWPGAVVPVATDCTIP